MNTDSTEMRLCDACGILPAKEDSDFCINCDVETEDGLCYLCGKSTDNIQGVCDECKLDEPTYISTMTREARTDWLGDIAPCGSIL